MIDDETSLLQLIDGAAQGYDIDSAPVSEDTKKKAKLLLKRKYKNIPKELLTAVLINEMRAAIRDGEHGSALKAVQTLANLSTEPKPTNIKVDLSSLESCAESRQSITTAALERRISMGEAQTAYIAISQAEQSLRQKQEEDISGSLRPIESYEDAEARIAEIYRRIKENDFEKPNGQH